MQSGIILALLLICTLLAFLVGASAAMLAVGAYARAHKSDIEEQEESNVLREQWENFLSYDGNNQNE